MRHTEKAISIIRSILDHSAFRDRKITGIQVSWYESGEWRGEIILPIINLQFGDGEHPK